MRHVTRALAPLLLLAIATPRTLHAQGGPPAAVLAWQEDSLRSTALGAMRRYFVATPPGYEQGGGPYPVLVLLDASDTPQWVAALANVRFLASRGAVPPLIVVGIPNGPDRTRDLTPPATGSFATQFPTAGGADRFLDFITGEVLPAVRARHRAAPATILAGHSFGGLLGLHAAATRPDAFAAIVAMSPSLQYNDSTLIVPYADAVARRRAPLRLFVSRGRFEPPIDVTAARFAARLDSLRPAAVAVRSVYYERDTHGLTPLPSLVEGLRFVFEEVGMAFAPLEELGERADSATIMRAFEESARRYAAGARALGLDARLPEVQVNDFGYALLQYFRKPAVAVAVMRRNVEAYPTSANAHDSHGDALLAAGDSAGARAQFTRAVELAARSGHPVGDVSRKKLEQLGGRPAPSRRK